jgi:VWFA-related protein
MITFRRLHMIVCHSPLRLFAAALLATTLSAFAQDQKPPYQSQSVIRATTRLVVIDLVATGDQGGAITDLKREDISVLEDGVPQKLASFNFVRPVPRPSVEQHMQAGIVTNAPQYRSATSYNIILLDAVNTDFSSHAYAQDMLAKYLATSPDIQPTAVFALDGRLTILHDFTTDTKALHDVVAGFKPQGPTHIPDVYSAASPFGRTGSFQSSANGRQLTINTMHYLARALTGIPGRKNLVWISEGFPLNLFPEVTLGDAAVAIEDYSRIAEKIADELMNAQIALYPIDAAGVTSNDRFSAHTAMLSMSERTGGKTFYNRNDIETGVRTSIDDGATYYSLSYYPENHTWNSKFRKIEVKVARPGIKLQYRRGYFALDPASTESIARDFSNALVPDGPTATGVIFQAGVNPPSDKTQNKLVVNFGIDPHTIAFQKRSDDLQHASVSCVVWAYRAGKKGDPVQSESSPVNAALKPAEFDQIMKSYFPCKRTLSLKPGVYDLRLGVVDRTTNLIGTLTTTVTVN